jgi:hypothetical protein
LAGSGTRLFVLSGSSLDPFGTLGLRRLIPSLEQVT